MDERIRERPTDVADRVAHNIAEAARLSGHDTCPSESVMAHVIALEIQAFALSERDAATEQACKDVCEDCELNGTPQFINGEFIHPYGMGCGTRCHATPIRSRVAQEKK